MVSSLTVQSAYISHNENIRIDDIDILTCFTHIKTRVVFFTLNSAKYFAKINVSSNLTGLAGTQSESYKERFAMPEFNLKDDLGEIPKRVI